MHCQVALSVGGSGQAHDLQGFPHLSFFVGHHLIENENNSLGVHQWSKCNNEHPKGKYTCDVDDTLGSNVAVYTDDANNDTVNHRPH